MILKLLKIDNPKFKFLFLVECAQKVVIAGCEYSFLASEIINLKVFDKIKTILSSRTSINGTKERQELLVLTYLCCRDIAVDFRFELCRFLEEITDYLSSAFYNDTHDRYRPCLFKLMDLALVTHNPNLGKGDQKKMEYIFDKKKWYASLRTYEQLLLEELKPIKTYYREKLPPKVNNITNEFAARFCTYAYWDDAIWQNDREEEEEENNPQSSKRIKRTNKLQSVIEYIKAPPENPINFNWKWLIVMCELISNYPDALSTDDIGDIIPLLSECQPLIEFKEQIYAFTKCCTILLEREEAFKMKGNKIVYENCQKLWTKIADEALRCCSNSNKNLIESHKLLQLLIYHRHKFLPSSFIEGVIKIFVSNTTIKCDTTLSTLIILLKNYNLDSLANGKEYTKQILQFAFEKITPAVLKKVIAGNEKPSYEILAKIAVLCSLLKTDVINYYKNEKINSAYFHNKIIDLSEQQKYKEYIESVQHLMQLKTREKLIIECEDFAELQKNNEIEYGQEAPLELKCIIDEGIFHELMKLTELTEKIISEQSSVMEIKDYLKDLMANNELMMNLLSELLYMESTNQEKIANLFVTKRIVLNTQQIERMFTLIATKKIQFDSSDTNKIIISLNALFTNHYHSYVGKLIRSFDLSNCLNWIFNQVDRIFLSSNDKSIDNKFNLKAFLNAKMELKLRYLLITTLCNYFNYDGINTNVAVDLIDQIEFSVESNIDLHTIFEIIKIFGNQNNVPEKTVFWIWEAGIGCICQEHRDNLYIMNTIIDKLPEIKRFTEHHNDLTKHYATIYYSFSKLCTEDANSKKFFGPQIVAKFLHQFKYFHAVSNYFF